jgi:hypothetical protein
MEEGGGDLSKNRMATPKVESKVLPDTPQISLGFSKYHWLNCAVSNSPTCLNFLNMSEPRTHNLQNWQNVTTLWMISFCAYQIPSSRDTPAQSLRGAYITQCPPLPLTIFPNIFPLSWAFSLPTRLHPPRDLSSFLCCFQHVFSYLPVVNIVLSPHAFLPFPFVLSHLDPWLFHMRAILRAVAIVYSHKIHILPGFHVIYIRNPVLKCRHT